MNEWWCRVAFEGAVEPRLLEDIIDVMAPAYASASTHENDLRTVVSFTLSATTMRQAVDDALKRARAAVRSVGLRGQPVAIDVKPWADSEAELAKPFVPPLAGVAEVATMLGVSKQRVSTLASEHKDFPRPVAQLAAGPVWPVDWIERFNERWTRRRTGRPAKAPEPGATGPQRTVA